jgi:hypothetical protein
VRTIIIAIFILSLSFRITRAPIDDKSFEPSYALGPTALMLLANGGRFEKRLSQRELRTAAEVFKFYPDGITTPNAAAFVLAKP